MSAWNIFVSRKTLEIANQQTKLSLLPCGVDLDDTQLTTKVDARKQLNLDSTQTYILFAGAFDNMVNEKEYNQDILNNALKKWNWLEHFRVKKDKEIISLLDNSLRFIPIDISELSSSTLKYG